MRRPEEEVLRRDMREREKRARYLFGVGFVTQVKHRLSMTDLQQLYSPNGRQLRILAAGNGATEEDIGKFWFVVGYSLVGGDDVIPAS